MDLNYLYKWHQISPFMAANGSLEAVRRASKQARSCNAKGRSATYGD